MGIPLPVTNWFSLAAFKFFSLSLTFGILTMMFLGVVIFGSNLFDTLCDSQTCMSIFFSNQGIFLSLFFQISFQFLALLCLFLASLCFRCCTFGDVPASSYFPFVSFFLNSCFFILFWLNVYFFLMFQIVDLDFSLFHLV